MKYVFVITCKDNRSCDVPVGACGTKVLAEMFINQWREEQKANDYWDTEFTEIREVVYYGDII